MSLAMVYSPCQQFEKLYEPMEALRCGTLFSELNMPFTGRGR
ncbi:MAG: spore coat associated protein CotJA [Clostridia bacterium]|nr:spore coat associated protein CotJA [Clostridia bacterium]